MIAHVVVKRRNRARVLGKNPVGLMLYLFGPGRFNEHSGQRVVAASATLGVEDGTRLDHHAEREEIRALGAQLDSYRMALGKELPNGHLWHCSISLPPGDSTRERRLTDERWAEVVRTAVDRLGFDTEGKAPCRWIAVHHGQSTEGNEHVHLVANIVREDGTTASYFRDWVTLRDVCRDMEQRFGLQVVEGRGTGTRAGLGEPDVSRAQLERAKREGRVEPDQAVLARTVRAAVAVARTEAEFVGALRELGVLVRPRYAAGGRQEVVGYSVALKQESGRPVIWFGGGRLHRELTLTRLRHRHWQHDQHREAVPAADLAHARALAAWAGDKPGKVLPQGAHDAEIWRKAATVLSEIRAELIAVPVDQPELWALAAREATGVLSMWSLRVEVRPRVLARSADVLARSAQLAQARADYLALPGQRPGGSRQSSGNDQRFDLRGVAVVVSTASAHRDPNYGQVMLLRQMVRLLEAINQADRARGQALHAIEKAKATHRRLAQLQQHWTSLSENPRLDLGVNPQAPLFRPGPAGRPGAEI